MKSVKCGNMPALGRDIHGGCVRGGVEGMEGMRDVEGIEDP